MPAPYRFFLNNYESCRVARLIERADNSARLRWMFWIIQKTSWIIISNGKYIRGSDPIPATLRIDPLGPILHCSPRIPPFQTLFSHSISSTSTILLLIPWRIDLVGCCQTTLESTPTDHHSSGRAFAVASWNNRTTTYPLTPCLSGLPPSRHFGGDSRII